MAKGEKSETVRVEHLNYKVWQPIIQKICNLISCLQRVVVGMKILGQVVSVQPLALIISLPNQLFAHVPITEISTQLTGLLESMEDDDDDAPPSDEEDDGPSKSRIPDLFHLFPPGQYVRAVVSAVHPPGATDASVLGRARDEVQKASRRIELSLIPEKVNASVSKSDLRAGFVSAACCI